MSGGPCRPRSPHPSDWTRHGSPPGPEADAQRSHADDAPQVASGQPHWLWRSVDQDGYVLDEILQNRRNTRATKRLLMRLLRRQGAAPRRMVTDKLKSYGVARRQVRP